MNILSTTILLLTIMDSLGNVPNFIAGVRGVAEARRVRVIPDLRRAAKIGMAQSREVWRRHASKTKNGIRAPEACCLLAGGWET